MIERWEEGLAQEKRWLSGIDKWDVQDRRQDGLGPGGGGGNSNMKMPGCVCQESENIPILNDILSQ